jgi:hypothetical protein
MEDIILSLLDNHLAGFEPTKNRFEAQSEQHFINMMSDLTILKLKNKNQIESFDTEKFFANHY